MKMTRSWITMLAICSVVHAAQPNYAMLTCAEEVRKMSFASDLLFNDMLRGIGGVGMADTSFYPQAKSRSVTKIEVFVPYDNARTGIERWTITHDGDRATAYILYFVPDGHGGTNFGVRRDERKT
jgi:hypothetical protein